MARLESNRSLYVCGVPCYSIGAFDNIHDLDQIKSIFANVEGYLSILLFTYRPTAAHLALKIE